MPIAIILGLAIALGACHSTPKPLDCSKDKSAYVVAAEHAPLQIPAGMAEPERRNAITVPPATNAVVDKKTCYQHAPSYFGTAGRIAASPEETVADWAQAWADRNSAAVLAMYASDFITDAPMGSAAWLAQRGKEVSEGPTPVGRVNNLKIVQQGSDTRLATFNQQFGTNKVIKMLKLVRAAGVWKIASEQVITTESPATGKADK